MKDYAHMYTQLNMYCCLLVRSQVSKETTIRTEEYSKNDIFIEFLVRNQHLLKPSITIIIIAVAGDDDDDEIKLLSIQKYRFRSNGFKAYTFQLGFFSFSVSNETRKMKMEQ